MPDLRWAAFAVLLILCAAAVLPGETTWEYPVRMLDMHGPDGSCWRGIDADGAWRGPGSEIPGPVLPQAWLVGPPPSEVSAVTIPEDHWVNLAFSGPIANGDGADIVLLESGTMGEQALVFLTDGADQEYVIALAQAERTNRQDMSRIEIDLSDNPAPFEARSIRIVAVDLGGGSPGFDLASIQARVSHECGLKARDPNPPDGAVNVEPGVRLSWTPACAGGSQRIYLSDVESQVRSGVVDALLSVQPSDANHIQTWVELAKTYYWRVDTALAADADFFRTGDTWSFTVSDHLVIDGFETYPDSRFLQDSWRYWGPGGVHLGDTSSQTCDPSMSFEYSCDTTAWSYAFHEFSPAQDWTQAGARFVQVLLRGTLPDPVVGEVSFGLTDGVHEQIVPYAGANDIGHDTDWRAWRIPLEDFNDVDLGHVRGMAIGVRPLPAQPAGPCGGVIDITDISLYPAVCLRDRQPPADLNGDCVVDYRDLERMAADWLRTRVRSYDVTEPNEPLLWYAFDGNADDSAGTAHGQVQGRATFAPGAYGQAIRLAYQGDAVTIPDAPAVFARIREAITIAFWQYGENSSHRNDTICCSNYEYGKSNPAISIHLGCWENPGRYRWDCGYPWSLADRLAGRHHGEKEWTGRWNHWVFTKDIRVGSDGRKGRMAIYRNGELYDSRTGTDSPVTNVTSFEIGSGWYGRYDGLIDDFRIYDYALSPAEVAWLATNSTGTIEDPAASPADFNGTDRVDLGDFAILATQWLDDARWPAQ
ncbi:MAG: LamG domain-containing protein [Sedimentisphaerales bacterium]|nr:LamG domain-containing protein [Sedimentisphaerales bacterium]